MTYPKKIIRLFDITPSAVLADGSLSRRGYLNLYLKGGYQNDIQ